MHAWIKTCVADGFVWVHTHPTICTPRLANIRTHPTTRTMYAYMSEYPMLSRRAGRHVHIHIRIPAKGLPPPSLVVDFCHVSGCGWAWTGVYRRWPWRQPINPTAAVYGGSPEGRILLNFWRGVKLRYTFVRRSKQWYWPLAWLVGRGKTEELYDNPDAYPVRRQPVGTKGKYHTKTSALT